MPLVNTMEQLVTNTIQDIIGNDENFCKCSHCIEDAECLALNSLPAKQKRPVLMKSHRKTQFEEHLPQIHGYVQFPWFSN